MTTENTGQGPTLEAAQQRISGLLALPIEETQSAAPKPEPTPEGESQQAPAAPPSEAKPDAKPEAPPDDAGSEQATSEDDEQSAEAPPPQPRMIKVKVDGEEFEVTEEEAAKGYSRTDVFTRKTQALAEERAQWERESRETERAALAQWVASAKQLEALVSPTEPDWSKRAEELSPDEFQREFLHFQTQATQRKQVAEARAQVEARQQAIETEAFQARMADEQRALARELPDFADPVKAAALSTELATFAKSRGFTDDQLQITDHRLVLLLHDAMQGAKARASAPAKAETIRNKIERAIAPASPGSETRPSKKTDLSVATARARASGRTEDAAAAIAHLI